MTGSKHKKWDPVLKYNIRRLREGCLNKTGVRKQILPNWISIKGSRTILVVQKGILYRQARPRESEETLLQLVLPKAYREVDLKGCHDKVGHLGLKHMLDLMCDRFFWPCMAVQVKEHIGKCRPMLSFQSQTAKSTSQNIVATHPLELVHLDFLCLEPGKARKKMFWW